MKVFAKILKKAGEVFAKKPKKAGEVFAKILKKATMPKKAGEGEYKKLYNK